MSLSVAVAFYVKIPEKPQTKSLSSDINIMKTPELCVCMRTDLPGEVLQADSVFGVCVSMAHSNFELWVKQQNEVDPPFVSVHIHQERVFHHQPAA